MVNNIPSVAVKPVVVFVMPKRDAFGQTNFGPLKPGGHNYSTPCTCKLNSDTKLEEVIPK